MTGRLEVVTAQQSPGRAEWGCWRGPSGPALRFLRASLSPLTAEPGKAGAGLLQGGRILSRSAKDECVPHKAYWLEEEA